MFYILESISYKVKPVRLPLISYIVKIRITGMVTCYFVSSSFYHIEYAEYWRDANIKHKIILHLAKSPKIIMVSLF